MGGSEHFKCVDRFTLNRHVSLGSVDREGGVFAYLQIRPLLEQDVAYQLGERGLRDSKTCARVVVGVVQADTVARANWVA